MKANENNLFIILLRLKSYLVSMIDSEEESPDSLYYTEEYLQTKYPEIKEELISLLQKYHIKSDGQIAFDNSIHLKFKDIVESGSMSSGLNNILEKYSIDSQEFSTIESFINSYRLKRDKKIKDLVETLLRLARSWANLKNLQNEIDDFSELNEEDVLRPDEEKTYSKLDEISTKSLNDLNMLSKLYLDQLTDYLFKFGGDVQLKSLASFLKVLRERIEKTYSELIEKASGNDEKE